MDWFNFDGNQFVFKSFGLVHILYLLFFIGLIVLTYVYRDKIKNSKLKEIIRYFLIFEFIILYITFYIWYFYNDPSGVSLVNNGLPLHWCGLIGYLSIFMLISKNEYTYGVFYFWGLTAPLLGLIFPAFSEQFGIDHYRLHEYFLIHGSMFYTVFFLRNIYDLKPKKTDVYKAFYALILLTVIIYILNLNLGTNYLYLVYLPEEYNIFFFMKHPYHIAILLALMFVAFKLEYLFDKEKKKSTITYS